MDNVIFEKFWFEVIGEAGVVECGCPIEEHLWVRLGEAGMQMPACVDSMMGDLMHHAVALFESRHNPRTPESWRTHLVAAGVRLLGTERGFDEVTLRPAWNAALVEVVRPVVGSHPDHRAVFDALELEAEEPPSNSRWAWHENELDYWERRHGALGRLNFAIHQEDSVVFLENRAGYTFSTAVEALASSREAGRMRTAMLRSLGTATDTFLRELSKLRA